MTEELKMKKLALALVSASADETATSIDSPPAEPDKMYRRVDEHGVIRFSNVGPPN